MIYRLCMEIIKGIYGILGCGVVALEAGGIIFAMAWIAKKLRKR